MKKRWIVLGTAIMTAAVITACGSKDTTATTAADTTMADTTMADTATADTTVADTTTADTDAAESKDGTTEAGITEGESATGTITAGDEAADVSEQAGEMSAEEIKTFGEKVQKVVADQDMEALAELCAYPVYVSLGEGEGSEIEDKEAFVALDAAKLFTEGMQEEIAQTDLATLQQFGAGVIMGNENDIIFNLVDGQPAITGINLK